MSTPFTDIFDFFMMSVTDYRLTTLFNASQEDFETYLSGWLIPSIAEFASCDQSLAYTNQTFDETLTQKNINVLVLLMKKRWLEKEVDDILQMNAKIYDSDFKQFSEAQNMREKQNRLVMMQEEVSRQLVNYGLGANDWSSWLNQDFFTP